MNRIFGLTLIITWVGVSSSHTQQAPQILTGRISDSMCGASHQLHAGTLTERQCMFACLKALAQWVLVDQNSRVLMIANQDFPGIPLYAGRPVRLTGEVTGETIVASRIEAYPPHLHLGHVMTNWRDTPGGVGFLIAAISEARVASVHANLAGGNPDSLDDMKLHAGHVLHALDPGIEPKGPGAGYGVKKSLAGAQQHLDFAVKAEGASANVHAHATPVAATLGDVVGWAEEATAVAQKIRSSTVAADAVPLVSDLRSLSERIVNALAQTQARMTLLLKGEGLENAPR